ncbi:hypothetical protein B0H17DRAFT_1133124 [Mycena rosella]|uniref:Uncharacterized protein n=1 Tax=Mycena rosella TaxID=1033263 RepID=A0AAD7DJL3_MYCRO|nr:hypothetical protein B0H17DRAFT_1133124 [Mycena rosella]
MSSRRSTLDLIHALFARLPLGATLRPPQQLDIGTFRNSSVPATAVALVRRRILGGHVLLPCFFLALVPAALSSLVVEVNSKLDEPWDGEGVVATDLGKASGEGWGYARDWWDWPAEWTREKDGCDTLRRDGHDLLRDPVNPPLTFTAAKDRKLLLNLKYKSVESTTTADRNRDEWQTEHHEWRSIAQSELYRSQRCGHSLAVEGCWHGAGP